MEEDEFSTVDLERSLAVANALRWMSFNIACGEITHHLAVPGTPDGEVAFSGTWARLKQGVRRASLSRLKRHF
ncbi:hypothetical protein [Pseudomonas sp. 10S4]|uniref:hypothetical protein n=1 Tax=Pseudomonas sp. 10S4 TaxID=3048583 RepID=UPI002AC8FB4A|nr:MULTISPECIES: hypothetical protein [unclassified Pseudomonas]MEB0222910.1 hypothetical protein [Pseudomonas sp. 5S1]MEB0293045.1 hypothetical protein [Pseudomonas sp. 10S4]WPX17215.1 hypothetical protein RHM58_25345 [Pseudomonas sp. 10S4]